ncbi:hypothetical protein U1Q18_003828, partial [Sarracenia purpurea var. burkii]
LYYKGRKRMRSPGEEKNHGNMAASAHTSDEPTPKKSRTAPKVIDYSDPSAVSNLLEELDCGKFGSVSKEIKDLLDQGREMLNSIFAIDPSLLNVEKNLVKEASKVNQVVTPVAHQDVIELDDDGVADVPEERLSVVNHIPAERLPVVIIDSDDEDTGYQRSLNPYQEIVLSKPVGEFLMKDFLAPDYAQNRSSTKVNAARASGTKVSATKVNSTKNNTTKDNATKDNPAKDDVMVPGENEAIKDKGEYVGVEDDIASEEDSHQNDSDFDGLIDIWKEMSVALEYSKVLCV